MASSEILKDKLILAVDDEEDVGEGGIAEAIEEVEDFLGLGAACLALELALVGGAGIEQEEGVAGGCGIEHDEALCALADLAREGAEDGDLLGAR